MPTIDEIAKTYQLNDLFPGEIHSLGAFSPERSVVAVGGAVAAHECPVFCRFGLAYRTEEREYFKYSRTHFRTQHFLAEEMNTLHLLVDICFCFVFAFCRRVFLLGRESATVTPLATDHKHKFMNKECECACKKEARWKKRMPKGRSSPIRRQMCPLSVASCAPFLLGSQTKSPIDEKQKKGTNRIIKTANAIRAKDRKTCTRRLRFASPAQLTSGIRGIPGRMFERKFMR